MTVALLHGLAILASFWVGVLANHLWDAWKNY